MPTLGDLLRLYQHDYMTDKAPNTQYAELRFFAQVLRDLGDVPIELITPEVLRRWKEMLSRQHKASTVGRYMARLSTVLRVAVEELEWLPTNPMRKIRKPKRGAGIVRYLAAHERMALLAACQQSRNPSLYGIVVVAIALGGRKNEVRCLRWEQVDLEAGVVHFQVTKTSKTLTLPLLGEALEVLTRLAQHREPGVPWVFPSPSGQRPRSIKGAWYAALQRAHISNFRFHDLRHTTASYLAMSGATIQEISRILGHAAVQESLRYIHLTDQHLREVLDRMDKKYLRKEPPCRD